MLSSNFALARRLEMTEAAVAQMTADAFIRAGSRQEVLAESIAGGIALFAGTGSPLTHALGVGMNGPVALQEMDRLESFFHSRGSACLIDLCSMADSAIVGAVMDRRYRIVELNNVMVCRLSGQPPTALPLQDRVDVQVPSAEQGPVWTRTVLQGFMGEDEISAEMLAMMDPTRLIGTCYLAARDAEPVAGAAMAVHHGVADLFADSTLVSARGLGIQQALIRRRMADALEQGCDLAMCSVLPGSSSHRNYERCGFQLAYMRVNVALDA